MPYYMAFNNIYNGKRVLLTGNTGFKGSWLTAWLIEMGAEVWGLSNGIPTEMSMFVDAQLRDKIQYREGDIRDLGFVRKVLYECEPQYVFHLAAQSLVRLSYDDPEKTYTTNIIGTMNVLEALRHYTKPCCAVMITSDKVYDNVEWAWGYRETDALGGGDPYSASKGGAELVIRSYVRSYFNRVDSKVRVGVGRAGNVIGGGDWALDRIVPDAIRAWRQSKPLFVRSALATRPWQHVLEPLSGYLALGAALSTQHEINGEVYNFGPNAGNNYSVGHLLKTMQTFWTDSVWESSKTEHTTHKEAVLLKLNCDKALHVLHWHPTLNFHETVEYVMLWYMNNARREKSDWDFTITQIRQYEQIALRNNSAWMQGDAT